jgi:hypothetical protein
MAKKRLSRDQKRKAKLAQRARKSPAHASLAYTGNKYKNAESVPVMLATETAIFQAYLVSGRELTDHHVRSALEQLVTQLRTGSLPPFEHDCNLHFEPGQEVAAVVESIRHGWAHHFEEAPRPGSETLIGILRTLLGSIETWSTPSPTSRGYLNYLDGFLKRTGVAFEVVDEDGEEGPEAEDEFLDWGREWCETDHPRAREQFLNMADELTAAGQWERVSNTAQRLLGEYPNGPVKELSTVSVRAQAASKALPGRPH